LGLYQITEKSYWYSHEKEQIKSIKAGSFDGAFCGWHDGAMRC